MMQMVVVVQCVTRGETESQEWQKHGGRWSYRRQTCDRISSQHWRPEPIPIAPTQPGDARNVSRLAQ